MPGAAFVFLLDFTVFAGAFLCFLPALLHCFFTGVARFSDALFTVLYRFIRAAANTRHAMSAVFAPHGFIVFNADIVQRTHTDAQSAAFTAAACRKAVSLYKHTVKNTNYQSI